jgi:hypothetical protein
MTKRGSMLPPTEDRLDGLVDELRRAANPYPVPATSRDLLDRRIRDVLERRGIGLDFRRPAELEVKELTMPIRFSPMSTKD